MNFALERLTQPEIEPVTLAEMKTHLRAYSSTEDDAEITAMIVAAREWVEDYTGRALIDQRWRLTISDEALPFNYTDTNAMSGIEVGVFSVDRGVLLRKSPVLALVSIASVDSAGVETALDVADYEVMEPDSKWPRLAVLTGGWSGTTRIVFRAGFADRLGSPVEDASVVPERFKQAMKLWVEAMYDRDEKMMDKLLSAAETIIKPERSELQIA